MIIGRRLQIRKLPRLPQSEPHTEQLSIPEISYNSLLEEYSTLKSKKDESIKSQNKISKDCQAAIYHLHRGDISLARSVRRFMYLKHSHYWCGDARNIQAPSRKCIDGDQKLIDRGE